MAQSKSSSNKATGNSFPFMETDMMKMMSDLRVPGMDMQKMADMQRKNIEAVNQANQTAVECMQALSRRQMEILRDTMAETSTMMNELMAQGGPEDKLSRQTQLSQEAFERALAHMRELSDMVSKANTEAMEIMTKRVSESLAELREEVDAVKKKTS